MSCARVKIHTYNNRYKEHPHVSVIGPVSLTFEANRQYDVIAVGSVADATLEPLVLDTPITPVSAGNVRVRVAHLASAAPEVDVYVSAPDAELTGTSPLGRFAFKGTLGPVEVPAGAQADAAVITADLDLMRGAQYTVLDAFTN